MTDNKTLISESEKSNGTFKCSCGTEDGSRDYDGMKREILDTRLSDLELNLGKVERKSLRKCGIKTIGDLVAKWPDYKETCARKSKSYGEYSKAVGDMDDLLESLNLSVPPRGNQTPTADRLERNARMSDQALVISMAYSIAESIEKEFKADSEKFRNVTMYDGNGKPYYRDGNGRTYYIPAAYSDKDCDGQSEQEREKEWRNLYEVSMLQMDDIYILPKLGIFVQELD